MESDRQRVQKRWEGILTREVIEEEYFRQGLTQKEIAKNHGLRQCDVSYAMKEMGIICRPKGARKVDITGQRFGRLVAIEEHFRKTPRPRCRWRCVCDCGNETYATAGILRFGTKRSCGCIREEMVKSNSPTWKGMGCVSGEFLCKYRTHSKRRGIEFGLNVRYMHDLLVDQGGVCAPSGIPLTFDKEGPDGEGVNASIDRIDSGGGYLPGNVQWVDKRINFMKQDLPQDEFIELCGKIVEFMREKKASSPRQ